LDNKGQRTTIQKQSSFGYTFEELRLLIKPMAENGVEAIGSMGQIRPWRFFPSVRSSFMIIFSNFLRK